MSGIFGIFIIIVFVIVEIAVFSAPVRIPALNRRAIASRAWRWGAIILLGSLPTLIHIFGLLWVSPTIEVIFATIYGDFESTFGIEEELRDEFMTELRWRTFISWDNERCFTGNEAVCAAADDWRTIQAERQQYNRPLSVSPQHQSSLAGILTNLFVFVILLSPSWLTGYAVHRITRDNRKQKHA